MLRYIRIVSFRTVSCWHPVALSLKPVQSMWASSCCKQRRRGGERWNTHRHNSLVRLDTNPVALYLKNCIVHVRQQPQWERGEETWNTHRHSSLGRSALTGKLYSPCAPAATAKRKRRRDVEYTQKYLPWEKLYQPFCALQENCVVHERHKQRGRGGETWNTHRHGSLWRPDTNPVVL